MFRRPPPPPLERKPTLPLSLPGTDPAATQALLTSAHADGGERLIGWSGTDSLLLSSVDGATGDSALHRAAAAGNTDFMTKIPTAFGPQIGHRRGQERRYWLLMVHQNLLGDTALHAAGRAGSLPGAKGVYRLLHHDAVEDDAARGDGSEDPMAEYWDLGSEDERQFAWPSLAFVCMRNGAGRTAAEEARLAHNEDVAAWLDALADRLDPAGKRADTDYVKEAWQAALESHSYLPEDDNEREQREIQRQLED
jgi:hypothetical protein